MPAMKTLKAKLLAMSIVTTSAALLAACGALAFYDYQSYLGAFINDARTYADIVAGNSTAALSFHDDNDAAQTLASLRAEPGHDRRQRAVVVGGDKKQLAGVHLVRCWKVADHDRPPVHGLSRHDLLERAVKRIITHHRHDERRVLGFERIGRPGDELREVVDKRGFHVVFARRRLRLGRQRGAQGQQENDDGFYILAKHTTQIVWGRAFVRPLGLCLGRQRNSHEIRPLDLLRHHAGIKIAELPWRFCSTFCAPIITAMFGRGSHCRFKSNRVCSGTFGLSSGGFASVGRAST